MLKAKVLKGISFLLAMILTLTMAPIANADGPVTLTYDLTRPGSTPNAATISTDGWQENRDLSTPSIFSSEVYMTDAYASYGGVFSKARLLSVGDMYVIDINVPTEGLYSVNFTGYPVPSAGLEAALKIDGQYIGVYNFSTENGQNSTQVAKQFGTISLTAGVHQFSFTRASNVDSGILFFSTLVLTPTDTPVAAEGTDPIPNVPTAYNIPFASEATVNNSSTDPLNPPNFNYALAGWNINYGASSEVTATDLGASGDWRLTTHSHAAWMGTKGYTIAWDFYLPSSGIFNLDYNFFTLANYGTIIKFYIDDAYVGYIDSNAGSEGTYVTLPLGGIELNRGKHLLKAVRGNATTGYPKVWMKSLAFTPTDVARQAPVLPNNQQIIDMTRPESNGSLNGVLATNGWQVNTSLTSPGILSLTDYLAAYPGQFSKARLSQGESLVFDINVDGGGLYQVSMDYNIGGSAFGSVGGVFNVFLNNEYIGVFDTTTAYSVALSGTTLNAGSNQLKFTRLDSENLGLWTIRNVTLNPATSVDPPQAFPVLVNFMNRTGDTAGATLEVNGWKVALEGNPNTTAPYTNLSLTDGQDFVNGLGYVDGVLGAKFRFNDWYPQDMYNELLAIDFTVVAGGWFSPKVIMGLVPGCGGILNAYIDGTYIGEIDARTETQPYVESAQYTEFNPIYVTAGVHKLMLKVRDLANVTNGQIWIKSLALTPIQTAITFDTFVATTDKATLSGTEIATITATATLSNSTAYKFGLDYLRQADANNGLTYQIENPNIISISPAGVVTPLRVGETNVTVQGVIGGVAKTQTLTYTVTGYGISGSIVSDCIKDKLIRFVKLDGSGEETATVYQTTTSSNIFSSSFTDDGYYNVYISSEGSTKATIQNVQFNASLNLGEFAIYAGDVNSDDVINIIDVAGIIAKYGQSASVSSVCNLDNNAIIGPEDLSMAIANIGKHSL